jgi:hypothetical protein
MTKMSEDVLEFSQVIGARIERNHLHDMQSPSSRGHKDLMQFWSAGTTKPSANVVIQGNVLESDEPLVHGIFVGNEIGRTNKSFKYQNIQILDNKVTLGHVLGLVVEHANNVTNLVVRGNDMTKMSEDVLEFSQVIGARIEKNHLHDMQSPSSRGHKDLMQMWSSGTTKPSANVVIQGNVLESDEAGVHGIFLGNEKGRANNSFKYQNIQILDNKITSGHVLGLVVEHANNVAIRGNDVRIHPDLPKKAINTPIIDVTPDSTGVTISGNTAHDVPSKAGWSVSGNKIVSGAGTTGASPGPVTVDQGATGGASGGGSSAPAGDGGTTFRFVGSKSKGDTDKIGSLDFGDGDRIILQDYASGTLKGQGGGNPLAVNKAGTYAILDSAADLNELAAASSAVTLASKNGGVVLSITQSGGRHDIVMPSGVTGTAAKTASGTTTTAKTAPADGGSNFSFTMSKSDKTAVVSGLEFGDGDRILLKSFPAGTLKSQGGGNPLAVNKEGTYGVLDSLADIKELDLASSAVSTRTLAKSDTLVIDIDPSGPGSVELHLHNHGQDFLAL